MKAYLLFFALALALAGTAQRNAPGGSAFGRDYRYYGPPSYQYGTYYGYTQQWSAYRSGYQQRQNPYFSIRNQLWNRPYGQYPGQYHRPYRRHGRISVDIRIGTRRLCPYHRGRYQCYSGSRWYCI